VLRMLENDLFGGKMIKVKWPKRRYWWGKMNEEKVEKECQAGIFLTEDFKNNLIGKSKNEHGKWLPIIEFSLFLMYALFIVYSIRLIWVK
jgi:hypothetical protein